MKTPNSKPIETELPFGGRAIGQGRPQGRGMPNDLRWTDYKNHPVTITKQAEGKGAK